MAHSYEIHLHGSDDLRPGHLELLIDGVAAGVTCDPSQFAPKALRLSQAEGLTSPDALAIRIGELQHQFAERSLQRIARRLQAGRLRPGGMQVRGGELRPNDDHREERKYGSEREAIEAFLNRGMLCGLTLDQRDERRRRRLDNRDRDLAAEWRRGRAELIAELSAKVAGLKAEAMTSPDRKHKIDRQIAKYERWLADLQKPIVVAATHGFQYFYGQVWQGAIDLVNDDIRAVPCMTNTTCDTQRDAIDQVSDFSTLDEFNGANYSSGGVPLAGQAVNVDDANDRAEFDADDFPAVPANYGAGTRDIEGLLLIKWVTNLNSSIPGHWLEPATDWSPDGSAFQWTVNAEGLLQAVDG